MKLAIPNELKADIPQTPFGKILSATPVVMAVVATLLAGLASSEMTRAQYDRSLAAQQQSKAGDQWSFFQAKRLRGALQRNAVDLLQNTTEVRPFDPSTLRRSIAQWTLPDATPTDAEAAKVKGEMLALLQSPAAERAFTLLQKGELPAMGAGTALDANIKSALDGVEDLKPDAEMAALLTAVDDRMLENALRAARDRVQAFDEATKPVNLAIDQFDSLLSRQAACQPERSATIADRTGSTAGPSLNRDFATARLRYAALRYEVEARLNQNIANLYELQVRKSNLSAERRHRRSQRFFFGMLGAQMGVIISTLAMAARQRNLLWSVAAGAGLLAIVFALYVYFFI